LTVRRLVYDDEREDGGPDIVMAARRMSAVPNPAYYPDAASLGAYLTDPSVSAFIDDVAEKLVVVTLVPKREEVCLTWGLPLPVKVTLTRDNKTIVSLKTTPAAVASLTALRAVAKAAERDMLARYPKIAEWRYWGQFQIAKKDGTKVTSDGGRALCLAWGEYDWPGHHITVDGNGNYSMWITFKDAVL
jgi:hypothetical protein